MEQSMERSMDPSMALMGSNDGMDNGLADDTIIDVDYSSNLDNVDDVVDIDDSIGVAFAMNDDPIVDDSGVG